MNPYIKLKNSQKCAKKITKKWISCLVVVDLDLSEDVILDEALEDGAVDLAEELA